MIEFSLDSHSGVSPYLQVVHQVRRALRLGLLEEGDQLPTVKDVVATLAINPNTVLKAYRELERDGLVSARPGVGTFVTRSLADDDVPRTRESLLRIAAVKDRIPDLVLVPAHDARAFENFPLLTP